MLVMPVGAPAAAGSVGTGMEILVAAPEEVVYPLVPERRLLPVPLNVTVDFDRLNARPLLKRLSADMAVDNVALLSLPSV